jgi:tetratricopeptide (TPR) repeat protein
LVFALVTGFALSAIAGPADVNPKKKAIDLVKLGIELQTEGRHELALSAFDEAWSYEAHPKVLFYKARSLMALKRFSDARDAYLRLQSESSLKGGQSAEIAVNLAEAVEQLRVTEVTIGSGGVPGVIISVDGRELGVAPVSATWPRGTYRLSAERAGYERVDETLIVAGEVNLAVDLLPKNPVAKPEPVPETLAIDRHEERDEPAGNTALAWTTLGAGASAFVAGGAFLGYYAWLHTRSLSADEMLEDDTIDLVLGASLVAVGVGLGVTSIFLFPGDGEAGPTAWLLPWGGTESVGVSLGIRY